MKPSDRRHTLLLAVALLSSCGAESGVFTEFDVPAGDPGTIVVGSDGNIWFTEAGGIGKITANGAVTEFPLASGTPASIAAGSDGNIWFTVPAASGTGASQNNKIGRFDVGSRAVTLFPTHVPGGDPFDLTAGPDGYLWFTDRTHSNIGRVFGNGDVTIFPVPSLDPLGIIEDAHGDVWFSTLAGVGRMSPSTLAIDWFGTEGGYTLASTGDGFVWFSNSGRPAIMRVSPRGDVVSFQLPDNMLALGMTGTPGGDVWFAASYSPPSERGNRIGRIIHAGTVEYFAIPTPQGAPVDIARDDKGALWFTENVANKIGRYQP